MNKETMISQVAAKAAEMTAKLNELMKDEKVSENTKKTQRFQRGKEIKYLRIIETLLSEKEVDEKDWLSIVTLSSERVTSQIEVHEGDNVVQLAFGKYKEVKDIVNKINKACEKAGLKIVDGVITK